jgi:adenosylcobinamide-GDP ribazoletransferase
LSQADSPSPRNDNSNPPERGNLVTDMVMALRFFSRLPAGHSEHETPDLNRIAMALPFASLVIGAGPAVLLLLMVAGGVPTLFAATAAVAAFAIVTGAMSEDAVADSADGLFGGNTPERRLEILKDSRHGTYGVLAIVFVVGLKVAALSAIAARNPLAAAMAWMAATTLARSGALYLPLRLDPARTNGAAAAAGKVSRNGFAVGIVFATVIALVLAAPFTGLIGFALALAAGVLVIIGWIWVCQKLVGGQTGDLIGAQQALLEIAILAVFMRLIVS